MTVVVSCTFTLGINWQSTRRVDCQRLRANCNCTSGSSARIGVPRYKEAAPRMALVVGEVHRSNALHTILTTRESIHSSANVRASAIREWTAVEYETKIRALKCRVWSLFLTIIAHYCDLIMHHSIALFFTLLVSLSFIFNTTYTLRRSLHLRRRRDALNCDQSKTTSIHDATFQHSSLFPVELKTFAQMQKKFIYF